jgi:hypothetical protein
MENSEVERLKRETEQLEKLLNDLKAELESKNKQGGGNEMGERYEDWEDEKVAYEIKL